MFANREIAGERLAEKLKKYQAQNPLVLAIPRGGVIVGAAVAKILHAPLFAIIARKVRDPENPEFAVGAICDPNQPLPQISGRIVILVDDGIATGHTAKAAIVVIKNFRPQRLIFAVPVLPRDAVFKFKKMVNRLVYLIAPEHFDAVGSYYEDFTQVTDEEVAAKLRPEENSS